MRASSRFAMAVHVSPPTYHEGDYVTHCIKETLQNVFASAESALKLDLKETTLDDVIDAVKTSGVCANKKAV